MPETRTEIPRWMPADRRGGQDRRAVERRKLVRVVARERRAGGDRRQEQRRSGLERRVPLETLRNSEPMRQTLLPYSREDAQRLRSGILAGDLTCPSCNQTVTEGPLLTRGHRSVREYRCMSCRKGIMVGDSSTA